MLAEQNRQQKIQLTEQSKLEVQKDRAEVLLDTHLGYLQTEYQISFEKAIADYEETEDVAASRVEVASLKEQIEDLGPVNLSAIEQFEQVNERHTFLATQRDDLLSAKNQLLKRWKRWMTKYVHDSKKSLRQFVKNSKWYFRICLVVDVRS